MVRSKTYISFYKEKTSLENWKDPFLDASTDLTVNKRENYRMPVRNDNSQINFYEQYLSCRLHNSKGMYLCEEIEKALL